MEEVVKAPVRDALDAEGSSVGQDFGVAFPLRDAFTGMLHLANAVLAG